jgi:hypothetical protein
MRRGNRKHYIHFLGAGQTPIQREHSSRNGGFGRNRSRQQGLSTKEAWNESKSLVNTGEGVFNFDFRDFVHLLHYSPVSPK